MKFPTFSIRAMIALLRKRPSRTFISALRATLALTIVFVLLFLDAFTHLTTENLALTSMILVVVVCGPGRSTGDCMRNLSTGGIGLFLLGFPGFIALASIGNSEVGQGFVLAIIVYIAALFRAQGRHFIPLYLFSILFAFQGVYTSVLEKGKFDRIWLLATFQAWAYGFFITIMVNFFVWPQSSETELLQLIRLSLRNVNTLSHLVCKTYEVCILEDEKEVRDFLINTIRSDYTQLTERVAEASFEVRYTKYSLIDFKKIITQVQALQQSLITVSSALELIETLDPKGINLKKNLLAKAEATENFRAFRKGIDSVILEIIRNLGNPKALSEFDDDEIYNEDEMISRIESQRSENGARLNRSVTAASVIKVGARLRREVQHSLNTPHFGSKVDLPSTISDSVTTFQKAWKKFAHAQTEAIISVIKSGALELEDVLQIEVGAPSLRAMYSNSLPKAWTSSLAASTPLSKLRSRGDIGEGEVLEKEPDTKSKENEASIDEDTPCSEALTKSFSLLFGLRSLTDELSLLHKIVLTPRKKSIRFRVLERFWFHELDNDNPMNLQEALHGLRGEKYEAPTLSLFRRFLQLEGLLRTENSFYAAKVAMGVTVYLTFLLSPSLQPFFLQYGISSSLITVIVAISPVLGQTLFTFILQLTGVGVGNLFGLIILEIFHNAGDYTYNPYGLTCALSVWALLSSYIFYTSPKWYSLGLLLINGAGTLVANEWLHLSDTDPVFGSPALRAAYALTAMSISIIIAAFFQIILFRTPARKELRLRIGAITFGLSAYNTLLQSYVNAVAPGDPVAPGKKPTPEAIAKLLHELIKREGKLQRGILAISETFEFARVEPKIMPFKGDLILQIIDSHQRILDRMREARSSLGSEGFSALVHEEFVGKLYPYRIHSQRLSRTLFYLSATSITSKTPLPRDVPSSRLTWASFENDALVLSRRLSLLPNGEEELRKSGFLRYWFYLTALRAVSTQLEDLESYLGELFGVPEETNPNLH